jgi:hypothetical protein
MRATTPRAELEALFQQRGQAHAGRHMWTRAVETYAPDSVSVTCLTRCLLRPVQH